MSSARFTLDVGNSSIGVAVWEGGTPRVLEALDPVAAAALVTGDAAAISVAPARLAQLRQALPEALASRLVVLERPPETLGEPALLASAGPDRIASVLAVLPGPAVVVDAGTAVTVDVVDAEGRYRGGFIAPGPAAAARGLADSTARLLRVPGEPVPLAPGGETRAAIEAGVWGLVVGGVDRLVEAALAKGGVPLDARIVATGGWGRPWASVSRHVGVDVVPGLVHRGIARWAGWE